MLPNSSTIVFDPQQNFAERALPEIVREEAAQYALGLQFKELTDQNRKRMFGSA